MTGSEQFRHVGIWGKSVPDKREKSGSDDLKTGGREGTHFRSSFGCILNNIKGFGDKRVT